MQFKKRILHTNPGNSRRVIGPFRMILMIQMKMVNISLENGVKELFSNLLISNVFLQMKTLFKLKNNGSLLKILFHMDPPQIIC